MRTPYYIVYEERLRRNLDVIQDVARRSGAEIVMAFKANALWRTFPLLRERAVGCTASSPNELRLGQQELHAPSIHGYSPVFTDANIGEFLAGCSHLTFNSLGQWQRHARRVAERNAAYPWHPVSAGLRVNPCCSVVATAMYDPSAPDSRLGVTAGELEKAGGLPLGIEGLHFHCLCEGSAQDLQKVLEAFEGQFGRYLPALKWVNMGGGHLMTRQGYDVEALVDTITAFRQRHPGLQVILEPGSAFTWQTGDLVVTVEDVVDNGGVKTALVDASFACHMPDTLEMPYLPEILEADPAGEYEYRLGGNSCLSGDYKGTWRFARPLAVGDRLTLLDMNHYTTVKTTMFNGLDHPDIVLRRPGAPDEVIRHFTYEDYRQRMS